MTLTNAVYCETFLLERYSQNLRCNCLIGMLSLERNGIVIRNYVKFQQLHCIT